MANSDSNALSLVAHTRKGAENFPGLLKMGQAEMPGIVLLHGRNSHPDGPVVGFLRNALNVAGFTTLSLANPLPASGDEFADYVQDQNGDDYVFPAAIARVEAGIAELKQRGISSVFLLGFSMGARLNSFILANTKEFKLPIRGFVALSMGVNGPGPLNATNTLGKVVVPVVDISGEGDADVAKSTEARKTAYESGAGPSYETVLLAGPVPHNFADAQDRLERAVREWLAKHSGQKR